MLRCLWWGALAVADRISDTSLGGMAGVSRFKSVVRSVRGAKAVVQLAASSEDVDQALSTWSVEQFSFSLRPFNPTPKRLGSKLHDLIVANGIGQMRGVALPTAGEYIHDADDGFVGEAVGLSEAGYGQISVKGRTSEGREAALGKPVFSTNREENQERQQKPRSLKVYFDLEGKERIDNISIAKALIDFYGK